MCFQLPFRYGELGHQEGEKPDHRLVNKVLECVRILNERLK
jgi:hypothetical protein